MVNLATLQNTSFAHLLNVYGLEPYGLKAIQALHHI